MKKYLLLVLVLSTGLSSATNESSVGRSSFSGFYAGATAGVVRTKLKLTIKDASGKFTDTQKIDGLSYGIVTGYGQRFNRFYLGAEIGIGSDTTNRSREYKIGQLTIEEKYNRGVVFSFAPRLGAILTNNCMLYVKPAIEVSEDNEKTGKVSYTAGSFAGDSSDKKMTTVFVPAVGVEMAFSKNILGRFEYGYNFGTSIKESYVTAGYKSSESIGYTAHNLKLGLLYKF